MSKVLVLITFSVSKYGFYSIDKANHKSWRTIESPGAYY